ncbi:MAG: patatin-like phospholipase family protein [Acidobacteria bacterium]|nr:patatin-like phospholipase family protein [Acidobacteriota bacterium]
MKNGANMSVNVHLLSLQLRVWVCVVAFIWAALHTAHGQDTAGQRRPKIGLALSGGGARGFAHIGVLQWFEEHRIPVDYIAGTSMGGLVGGMYAMGRSPGEMRDLVSHLDWDVLLRGYPSFQELSYRRKEDSLYIPGGITLGLRHGVRLPAGINGGMEIGLLFDRLTLPYDNIGSFDNLPIPFRCVATDLVAAEPVVLKEGSLANALRATMSIPGMFTPVELNGRILADGGILNNVPTDVVKQMGANVVIAVDIGTPLGDKESINSLFGVLNQTSGVATIENVRRNLRLADLLISPDLEKYTLLDFKANAEIANLGYKGAEQKALLLQKFSLNESEWQQYLAQRQARILTDVPAPTFVKVEGAGSEAGMAITKNLEKLEGKPIDPQAVENELRKVWGTGRFEALGYSWVRDNGKSGLFVRAHEKTYGPPFLTLGLTINNSNTDDTEVNLLGRLLLYDVGRPNAEWRTDFSLGSQLQIGTEYYRPLGESRFFVAPNASYDTMQQNLFVNGEEIAEYNQKTARLGVDLGYTISDKSQMRLGYSIGHLTGERIIGDPVLPDVSGTLSVATFRWNYYGQNSPQFPTRGLVFRSSASWFFKSPGVTTGFPQAEARAIYAYRINEQNILIFNGGGGTTFGREAAPFQKFALGGLFHLGGYGRGEFRGNNYLFGELGYMRRLYRLPSFLGGSIFAGAWYDGGSAFDSIDNARYNMSGTGGLLVETRLGPIFIGGAWAEGGQGKFYFALGRIF